MNYTKSVMLYFIFSIIIGCTSTNILIAFSLLDEKIGIILTLLPFGLFSILLLLKLRTNNFNIIYIKVIGYICLLISFILTFILYIMTNQLNSVIEGTKTIYDLGFGWGTQVVAAWANGFFFGLFILSFGYLARIHFLDK